MTKNKQKIINIYWQSLIDQRCYRKLIEELEKIENEMLIRYAERLANNGEK